MPISKKRFSKKRVKKSIRKNTRKHKKRTHRRKYRKSSRRLRFFGGDGEDEECPICAESLTNGESIFTSSCEPVHHIFHTACIERWCNGKQQCTCPSCRTIIDPNLLPDSLEPFVPDERTMYKVKFYIINNGVEEPISVHQISDIDIVALENYFINNIITYDDDNIVNILNGSNVDFFGGLPENQDSNGYIKPTVGRGNEYVTSFHDAMRQLLQGDTIITTETENPNQYIARVTLTDHYGA